MSSSGNNKASTSQKTFQYTTNGDNAPISGGPQNNADGTIFSDIRGGLTLNTTADPVITGQAFATVTSLVGQALAQQNQTQQQVAQQISDANGANNNALNSVLASVLSRDQAIASDTATGGASGYQKTILWILGILAAGIVTVLTFGKKKPA